MEDIEIARSVVPERIGKIAESLKIPDEYLEQYGKYKAKISNKYMEKLKEKEESLAIEDGFYEFDFNVKDGSNYLIINGDNYSGKVNIEIK